MTQDISITVEFEELDVKFNMGDAEHLTLTEIELVEINQLPKSFFATEFLKNVKREILYQLKSQE